jgi:plastocyanin
MTVHQIKIKNKMFEPRTLKVKQGDQIQFQLDGRTDQAEVEVTQGQLFEGENKFVVGSEGKAKIISRSISPLSPQEYRFSTTPGLAPHEKVPQEQTGTMTGSIIVIP